MTADDLFGPVSDDEAECTHPIMALLNMPPQVQLLLAMGVPKDVIDEMMAHPEMGLMLMSDDDLEQECLKALPAGSVFVDALTGEEIDIDTLIQVR